MVVFRLPKDEKVDYVKRVIGLPGDRIQMKAGPALYQRHGRAARAACRLRRVQRRAATFAGEALARDARHWASYETLDCVDSGFYDNTNIYTVPQGHYFMMGDNRDNSTDSRAQSAVGYVPFENIVGRAGMIFFSRKEGSGEVRRERIGKRAIQYPRGGSAELRGASNAG